MKGIYIAFGFIPFLLLVMSIVLSILYLLKSLLGIDIFPGGHFWEFL